MRLSVVLFIIITIIICIGQYREQQQWQRLREMMRSVQVDTSSMARPVRSDEAIRKAMVIYTIDSAPLMLGPVYHEDLEDRGRVTLITERQQLAVTVGPTAFANWGELGSTLAHEIEVHCHQSWFLMVELNFLGAVVNSLRQKPLLEWESGWGSTRAERQAYTYEIDNRERFEQPTADIMSLVHIMNSYYPEQNAKVWR